MQVQGEIRRGTITVFISKYSNIFIGLAINSVLARLLSPGEYGILGIVTVFISFFNILSDIGLGVAIVQNQDLTDKDRSDIFKVSIFLSGFLAILFALLSYGIAWYYESDIYILIGQLLAINVFFSALSVVPKSMLIKKQAFKLLGIMEVSVALATGVLAIFLAGKGWSYYSIVWRSIISSAIIFGLHAYYSHLKLVKGFALTGLRKIARYSFFQFAFNFINYFSRNLDNILIGKYMGNQSLGIYNQSYQLMMYPVSNLTHVITPVLHPVLAKFKNEPKIIFEEYIKVVRLLAMLGIPISILIFFASDEIIFFALGNKWMSVVPILRIFSISIWIQMISSSGGAIFQAIGRTDMLFKLGLFCSTSLILSILIGVLYFDSLNATAFSLSLAFLVNFSIVFYVLIRKLLHARLRIFAKSISSQFLIGLILIVLLYLNQLWFDPGISSISRVYSLAIKMGIVGTVFGVFHFSQFKSIYQKLTSHKA